MNVRKEWFQVGETPASSKREKPGQKWEAKKGVSWGCRHCSNHGHSPPGNHGRICKGPSLDTESREHHLEPWPQLPRGTCQRAQHDRVCGLHRQVWCWGQFANLLTVLTFPSFNLAIPEEIIRNVHQDLCTTLLIRTLFILAQSPK